MVPTLIAMTGDMIATAPMTDAHASAGSGGCVGSGNATGVRERVATIAGITTAIATEATGAIDCSINIKSLSL